MAYSLIDNNNDLAAFCKEASSQEMLAVDTEFLWRSTYYPMFALLQMGWDKEHTVLVDVLAITDKAPLVELMENSSVLKVFHDAFNDVPIIDRWCNCHVHPFGDTIVAAGFANLTARMSLAKLLTSQLGVVLPKTETCSDWMQRPLTAAQLEYAGDDVALLCELYRKLLAKVEECGNMAFYQDEMKQRACPDYYAEMPAHECWKRINRPQFLHFTRQDIAVLCELATWRENTARQENKPRNAVFRDEWLVTAAVKHPYTAQDVEKLPGIYGKQARLYGESVAEVVTRAMKLQPQDWPEMHSFEYDKRLLKQRVDRVVALMNKRAEARGIDPLLLGARRAAEQFVLDVNRPEKLEKTKLMTGWKHDLLRPVIDSIALEYQKRKN